MSKTDKKSPAKTKWADLLLVALFSACLSGWAVHTYRPKMTPSVSAQDKKVVESKKAKDILFNVRVYTTYSSLDDEIKNCQGSSSEYAQMLSTSEFSLKFNYVFLPSRSPGQLVDPGEFGLMNNTSVYRYHRSKTSTLKPVFVAKMDNANAEEAKTGEFQIVALKDSNIKSLNDLEGKVIQIPDMTNKAAVVLAYFFESQQVKFKSSVSYPSVKEGLLSLEEKKADAIIVYKDDADVELALRGKLADSQNLQVIFTSNYKFPIAFIYGSHTASAEEELKFKRYLKAIFNDPEKMKAFTYCTQVLGLEDLDRDGWKNTLEKFEVAANYLRTNVKALKEKY